MPSTRLESDVKAMTSGILIAAANGLTPADLLKAMVDHQAAAARSIHPDERT